MTAFLFRCPKCGQVLKLPPGFAKPGDVVVCPHCRNDVRVPNEAEPALATPPDVAGAPPPSPASDAAPASLLRGERPAAWRTTAIALAMLLGLAVASLLLLHLYFVRAQTAALQHVVARLTSRFDVSYGKVSGPWFERRIDVTDLLLTPRTGGQPIRVDHVALSGVDTRHPMPHRLSLEADGIHLPPDPELLGPAGSGLKALGYESLTGRMTCRYTYDPVQRQLAITPLTVRVEKLAELEVDAVLAGASEADVDDWLSRRPAAGFQQWQVLGGHCLYRDDSFADRFLTYQAAYIGESLADLRQGMFLDISEARRREKDEFTRASLRQFSKFIQDTRYVAITAQPAAPITCAGLKKIYYREGLQGLVPALKLTFATERPTAGASPAGR